MGLLVVADLAADDDVTGTVDASAFGPDVRYIGGGVTLTAGTTATISVSLQVGVEDVDVAATMRWFTVGAAMTAAGGSLSVPLIRNASYRMIATTVGAGNTLRCMMFA